jgi:hypothetical protein
MKSRRKIIFVVIGLFLIAAVSLNFSYNKAESSAATMASWPNQTTTVPSDTAKVKPEDLSVIVMHEKDTLYKVISKTKPVVITVKTLETGPLWIPLYKSIDYTAEATIKEYRSKVPLQLITSGHLSLTGNYSGKQASDMINKAVGESLANETKRHFSGVE